MANFRSLGYKISSLVNDDTEKKELLYTNLGFSENDFLRLKYGRLSLSPVQIKKISSLLSVNCDDLISYSNDDCYKNDVHCMSSFSNQKNCDEILDIIDSYIDIKESLK